MRKKDNIVGNPTKGAVHEEKDNVSSLYWPEDSKSLEWNEKKRNEKQGSCERRERIRLQQ